eukprot:snap_masked-scaffold_17-processed-gene-4.10-mRNA-1 protein AED:0.37 eAED:0.43 QI:0/0/0/1/1/1/2/0/104
MSRKSARQYIECTKIRHKTISEALISAGLKPLPSEKCLFTNERRKKRLIVLVYVDDLLYSGEEKEVDAFENMMSERFKLTFNQVAETYVGLCLSKGRNKTCYVN